MYKITYMYVYYIDLFERNEIHLILAILPKPVSLFNSKPDRELNQLYKINKISLLMDENTSSSSSNNTNGKNEFKIHTKTQKTKTHSFYTEVTTAISSE